MVAIFVILTIAAFIAFDYFFRVRKQGLVLQSTTGATANVLAAQGAGFEDNPTVVPAGVFMAPNHTWLTVKTDGDVKVGAGSVPLWALDGVEEIDFLRQGTQVNVGDQIAVLKNQGREVTLHSPVDGTIAEVNQRAASSIKKDFVANWLYEIQPSNLDEDLVDLRIGAKASSWLKAEMVRFRDLMAVSENSEAPALADGGLPVRGLAKTLKVETWKHIADEMFS